MEACEVSLSKIRALLYHDIVDSASGFEATGFPGASADHYKLDRSAFASHLELVAKWYNQQSPGEAIVGALLNIKPTEVGVQVIFTFDDAGLSSMEVADLLERRGWRGHFFAPTRFVDSPGFMSGQHLRELQSRGHSIGSHSASHPLRMAALHPDEIYEEWSESVDVLSNLLSVKVTTGSVPGGLYSGRVREAAARAGIELLFNSEPKDEIEIRGNMAVCGRYSVVRTSPDSHIRRVVAGDRRYAFGLRTKWEAKKVIKRFAGPVFMGLRDRWFNYRQRSAIPGGPTKFLD